MFRALGPTWFRPQLYRPHRCQLRQQLLQEHPQVANLQTKNSSSDARSLGIGRSTAIALLKAGWNVILTARRDDALQETAKLATESGATGKSFSLSGDITDEAFVKRIFTEGNAGIGAPQLPIEEVSLETFQQVIAVNLIGPFLCTREAVKTFKSQSPQGVSTNSLKRSDLALGNAHTHLAARHTTGALQANGHVVPEATFDVKHVADSIVHIASLPNDVTVLQYNIMCVPAHWKKEGNTDKPQRATEVPYVGRG
ncbi:hypothetical protein C0995_000164 [Termitomyces sp. Mi166|nr:hypothetical protein C0995_000164 [Termitomyces sp. Mi166\